MYLNLKPCIRNRQSAIRNHPKSHKMKMFFGTILVLLFCQTELSGQTSPFFTSDKVDFFQINSTLTEGVKIAIAVYKPLSPSPVLLVSHGWHGSIRKPDPGSENPNPGFLTIHVDMRGREYSTGRPDCNGYELYDFYDAYKYALAKYPALISDTGQVYFSGESGGGGNGFSILGKFPDLFCNACILCGISDYAEWFKNDKIGEFRDEMLPWIGFPPEQNPGAYAARSGITTVRNLLTPVYIVHGETDIRVPSAHSRTFYEKAKKLKKDVEYLELKNVGTRDHYGNITENQIREKDEFIRRALSKHPNPVLPEKGDMIVAGYLVTKHFSVFLNSIDEVGEIKYDLRKKKVKFISGEGKVIFR